MTKKTTIILINYKLNQCVIMKTKLLLLLSLLFFMPMATNAKFFKKLKEKVAQTVEETVSKKIEKKAEKKTESSMDSLFKYGQSSTKGSREKSSKISEDNTNNHQDGLPDFLKDMNLSKMMEMSNKMTNAKVAASYTFNNHLIIEVSQTNEKNKLEYFFGDNVMMNIVDAAPQLKNIYDYINNSIITINEVDNTLLAIPLDFVGGMMDMMGGKIPAVETENDDTPTNFKKTGKYKNILGYRSEEYIAEDENMKLNLWFSSDVPFDNSQMMEGLGKMGAVFAFDFTALSNNILQNGLVMEMKATEKQNQMTTQVKVIGLKTNQSFTVNTSSYKRVNPN
jgi:hypothetical protein